MPSTNFQIFTDTSCDLSKDELTKNNIGFISYLVNVGGNPDEYIKEVVDLSVDDFYNIVRDGSVMPKTSMPAIGAYIDEFKKALDAGLDVLCITLTKKFSGSFASASNAKKFLEEEYPERKIMVIDSETVAGAQGLFVLEAVRMKNDGLSMEDIYDKLLKIRENQCLYITVDTLKYLQKGGRIGKVSAFAGALLNIKPLIIMDDGELIPIAKIRGRKKTISEIITLFDSKIRSNKEQYQIAILHCDAPADAEYIKQTIINEYNYTVDHEPFKVGLTIGSHIGPTTIGLGYMIKYEYV